MILTSVFGVVCMVTNTLCQSPYIYLLISPFPLQGVLLWNKDLLKSDCFLFLFSFSCQWVHCFDNFMEKKSSHFLPSISIRLCQASLCVDAWPSKEECTEGTKGSEWALLQDRVIQVLIQLLCSFKQQTPPACVVSDICEHFANLFFSGTRYCCT